MSSLQFHDIAGLFPLMEGAEFESLAEDIRANGLREPIWLHDGKVVDGRNRFRACEASGVEPVFREYEGEDGGLLAFVISLNLKRRHLSESQRSMIAAKVKERFEAEAKQRQVATQNNDRARAVRANLPEQVADVAPRPREQAAALLNVSPRSVEAASSVQRNGTPALAKAVESGDVSVSAAAEVAKLPEPEQIEVVEQGPVAVKEAARDIRTSRQRAREEELEQAFSQIADADDDDDQGELFSEPGDEVPPARPTQVREECSKAGVEKWRELLKGINRHLVAFGKVGGLIGMTRGRRKDAIRLRDYLAEIRDRIDAFISDFDEAYAEEATR